MTPSEELRFDFGVAETDPAPTKRRSSNVSARAKPEDAPNADDLLARIQRVQQVATKATTTRKRSAAKRAAPRVDDERAPSRHPSRGPALSALPEEEQALAVTPD